MNFLVFTRLSTFSLLVGVNFLSTLHRSCQYAISTRPLPFLNLTHSSSEAFQLTSFGFQSCRPSQQLGFTFPHILSNHAHFLIAKASFFPPHSLLAFTISHLLSSLGYCPCFFNPTQFGLLIFLSHDHNQTLILTITPSQRLRSIFLFQGLDLLLATPFTYTYSQ